MNFQIDVLFLILAVTPMFSCKKAKQRLKCNTEKQTNTYLWSLKRDPPAYFFGTIHVPYTRVWNHIPRSSKKAFERSDKVFFELDLTDPHTVAQLAQCQMLPRDTDLREVLPESLYQRIKRHLNYVKSVMPNWVTSEQKGKGLYADILYNAIVGNWEQKKPIWLLVMISSLTKMEVRSRGSPVLDFHLARKALELRKEVGAVEKVAEQCQPLNHLNLSHVLYALNKTLLMQEEVRSGRFQIPYSTEDLIGQYNCGELDASIFDQIPELGNTSVIENWRGSFNKERTSDDLPEAAMDSYFKTELIHRRNERMSERIIQLLNARPNQSFFFAFGAGHFIGNLSVIDYLQKHGYEIRNIQINEKIKKSSYHRPKSKRIRSRNFRHRKKKHRQRKLGKTSRRLRKEFNNNISKKRMSSRTKNKTNSPFLTNFLSFRREEQKLRRNSFVQKRFRLFYSNKNVKYNPGSNQTGNAHGSGMEMCGCSDQINILMLTFITCIMNFVIL